MMRWKGQVSKMSSSNDRVIKVVNNISRAEMDANRREFILLWKLQNNVSLRRKIVFVDRVDVVNRLVGKNVVGIVALEHPINIPVRSRRKFRRCK